MAEGAERKNWRQLCAAAVEAKDPDELQQILQELNKALKHESCSEIRFNHCRKSGRLRNATGCKLPSTVGLAPSGSCLELL
jgi:hypothetical protein